MKYFAETYSRKAAINVGFCALVQKLRLCAHKLVQ